MNSKEYSFNVKLQLMEMAASDKKASNFNFIMVSLNELSNQCKLNRIKVPVSLLDVIGNGSSSSTYSSFTSKVSTSVFTDSNSDILSEKVLS